jgi:hypothetical protein
MTKIMSWNLECFDINKITLPSDFETAQREIKKELRYEQGATAKDFITKLWGKSRNQFMLTIPGDWLDIDAQKLKDAVANICNYCLNFHASVSTKLVAKNKKTNAQQFIRKFILDKVKDLPPQKINDQSQIGDYLKELLDVIENLVANPDKKRLFMIVSRVIKAYVDSAPGGKPTNTYLATNLDAAINNAKHITDSLVPTSWSDNVNSILRTIKSVEPDVFIAIEVVDSNMPDGQPSRYNVLQGCGGAGAMRLLAALRCCGSKKLEGYRMVPPVRLGGASKDKEGIAVYYDSAALEFLGPWVWTNQNKAADPTEQGITVIDYPALYANALPDPEKQRAGQGQFFNPPNHKIDFGKNQNFRTPFLTQFKTRANPQRTFNILSVHNQWDDRGFGFPNTLVVWAISQIEEMTTRLGSAVGVVIGDFNVPGGKNGVDGREVFKDLEGKQYQLLIDVRKQPSHRYVQTHLNKGRIEAWFYDVLAGQYPTYQYWGTWNTNFNKKVDGGLDNALVRQGNNPKAIILNLFTGVTWNFADRLGYSGQFISATGADGNTFPSVLQLSTIVDANQNLKDLPEIALGQKSEMMRELKRIVGVSDHLPIVIEV